MVTSSVTSRVTFFCGEVAVHCTGNGRAGVSGNGLSWGISIYIVSGGRTAVSFVLSFT